MALRSKKQPMTPIFLSPVLARMRLEALLLQDPTVLVVKGRSRAGQRYSLRKALSMVPIF